MDIRNGLEGLKSLLGVTPAAPAPAQSRSSGGAQAPAGGLGSDQATVSSAGSQVAQTASQPADRAEKISGVQAALLSGTYNVAPAAVASKVVDSMLSAE